MDKTQDLTGRLERIFLKEIISLLKDQKITILNTKYAAQAFLNAEPFESVEDAMLKIKVFLEKYSQFGSLKVYVDSIFEEKKTGEIIDKMKMYIKDNDIDKALQVAQENS